MQGKRVNGLYCFEASNLPFQPTPETFLYGSTSFTNVPLFSLNNNVLSISIVESSSILQLWHKRLGHPSSKAVQYVLSSCNIPYSNNIPDFFSCL